MARRTGIVFLVLAALLVWSDLPAYASLPDTSSPVLQLDRTIRTSPFAGSTVSMKDAEGSAYVPADDSLWLADDNGKAIYEVDRLTGALKRMIGRTAFEAATQFGGGSAAGLNRVADLESMAYDRDNDTLYAFSGICCSSSVLPTVFRLQRDGSGAFQVESYQPLAAGSDFTAAAWDQADGTVWVGKGRDLRPYDYITNSAGPIVRVAGLSGILGLGFSDDGADLFAVTNAEMLVRVDWAGKTIVDGWTFDLTPSGVLDSRAVELIDDQFYVLDGYDGRASDDPLRHAVFVFNVIASPTTAPSASFTASLDSGDAPLTVSFTDTSTGEPTSWEWDFGDGGTSLERHPVHTYDSPGTYTVSLTASNSKGQSTATGQITVTSPPPPTNLVGNPGFETDTTGWGTSGSGSGVTLSRVEPGRDGSNGAALLTNGATNTRKCVLNDEPNWVASSAAGSYTASLWVRGDSTGALLKLALRELDGGSRIGGRITKLTLTTDWQLVTVVYTPRSPGTSSLDLQVFLPRAYAPPGTCFYADDASITTA